MIGEPMTDRKRSRGAGHAPENLEALYTSANFHELVYRDFSASRIDVRARFRYRMLREEREPTQPAPELTSETQSGLEGNLDANPGASGEMSGISGEPAGGSSGPQPLFASDSSSPQPETSPQHEPAPGAAASMTSGEVEPLAPPPAGDLLFRPRPRWLDPGPENLGGGMAAGSETLQRAKERVASRWFGLKGLFARSAPPAEVSSEPGRVRRVPVIAVFSFAGGAGKTSLIATLGRAMASYGEQVLLADTTPFGLLPFYFGARDLKSGVVRTFAPPNNSIDAPVHVVALDAWQPRGDEAEEDPLVEALLLHGQNSQRILVDVQTASKAVLHRLLTLTPTVLAPLLPEMNSVVSVSAIESLFSGPEGAAGQNIKPIYLLNQFDPSLPLHVDVREVLQDQLGDRLLPFAVRQSSAVSEALAQGMTVVDYTPNSSVAEDYLRLADWFRSVSAVAANSRGVRWSERTS
jgi:cellulose synthase operon protein YhjQ